jgi:Zn-dependent peptidase ImmA (M78 family)
MGKATPVPVTPQVVEWAIKQSGLSDDDVARRLKVPKATVRGWQTGAEQPIITEVRKLATLLRRPFAAFLLPRPPVTPTPSVELRRPPGSDRDKLNPVEQRHIREAARLQRLLSWLRSELDVASPTLPRPRPDDTPEVVATKARAALGIDSAMQASWDDASEAFTVWRQALQDHGIFVFLFRMGKDSVRGFSLADERAPLLAINTWWRTEARIFTAFHEYGHLLTRTSSACIENGVGRRRASTTEDAIERWCERFAAAVLIPKVDLFAFLERQPFWNGKAVKEVEDAGKVASYFKVSLRAAVLRLIEEGAATWDLYKAIPPASDHKIPRRGGRGQSRAERRDVEYGRPVVGVIHDAVRREIMSRDDALGYLNVSDAEFDSLIASGQG